MNRSTTLLVIAVALAGYGVYAASFVLPMLVGPPMLALPVAFVLQAVCALAAAFGVWRHQRWAAGVVVLLGVAVAVTWLFEGFILGLVAYLRALLAAAIALIVALAVARYVNGQRSIARD
jgi:hypothetical protein